MSLNFLHFQLCYSVSIRVLILWKTILTNFEIMQESLTAFENIMKRKPSGTRK